MTRQFFTILLSISLFIPNFLRAHPSWGIVVDKHRNIYFADIMHYERGSVWKLSNTGELTLLFKDFHAHNVSLDKNGNLVTAHGEMDEHTMLRVNQSGTIDTLYHATNYLDFNGGNCTYSPKEEIIFGAGKHLWRINEKGAKERISKHKFGWNQTVYADRYGNYYAPDIGDGKGKLIKIDSHGEATIIAENLITKSERPYDKHGDILMGVTEGCDGKIYIAELAGQRIIRINKNSSETFYRSEGDWIPSGIDFFAGDAYILEYKQKNGNAGPRIIKVDESGKKTIIFDYDSFEKNEIIQNSNSNNKGSFWFVIAFLLIGIGVIFTGIVLKAKKPLL